jgi:hypothetical protein
MSTLIGLWIAPRWGTAPVDMIYLPAVLAAAALWGIGPGLVAGSARRSPTISSSPRRSTRCGWIGDRCGDGRRAAARRLGHQPPRRRISAARHGSPRPMRSATRLSPLRRRLLSSGTERELAQIAAAN